MSAGTFAAHVAGAGFVGLKSNSSNVCPGIGSMTWNSINNKKFETLSYIPSLPDDSMAKQIDNMLNKGWTPCIEFDEVGCISRENSLMPGYYDGRCWTLWKLPMFGCADSSQVLKEIHECKQTYPNAYIRCLAFDISATCSPWLLSFTNLLPLDLFSSSFQFLIKTLNSFLSFF